MRSAPSPQPAKGVVAMRRVTNCEIADRLGISHQYVSKVLNGHAPPSERFRYGLAQMLGVPEAELFDTGPDAA